MKTKFENVARQSRALVISFITMMPNLGGFDRIRMLQTSVMEVPSRKRENAVSLNIENEIWKFY